MSNPPKAKKIPHIFTEFGKQRTDNYYWLRERENPEVIDYLKAENNYYHEQTAHSKLLQDTLFAEMKSRIKENDSSVPYYYNGYWYQTQYQEAKDYPIYVRYKETLNAPEELLFDANEMAKGKAYFQLDSFAISDDNQGYPNEQK